MPKRPPPPAADPAAVAPLPGWIMGAPAQRLEDAAFRSGAALAHLQAVSRQAAVPGALWRDRLALAAAEVCAGLSGRCEGARALRDAVHLTRPGGSPGPAGMILRQWSQAVLADDPRAETAALILAEAVLAQALGRDDLLPVMALGLTRRDLARSGEALRAACHRAVVAGAGQAVPLAADLARRAVRLQAVLPKLRARGRRARSICS